MRLIDADELKKCVLKWLPQDPCGREEKEFPFETDICVSMLMEIDEQPTITPEPHWIPVTERFPEVSGLYLVSVKNDHERRYSKTVWFEKDVWFARQDVIAWMLLPESYKGVTE